MLSEGDDHELVNSSQENLNFNMKGLENNWLWN